MLILLVGAASMVISCDDGDAVVDQVTTETERGAILRTVNLISSELPIGVESGNFSVELEVQDSENGNLVNQVEVYIGFRDNTETVGLGTNVQESLYTTISSSEFKTGPFGLPRFNFSVTLPNMLNHIGRTNEDIYGGDEFTVRFELVLTDGRRYSYEDNTGTLTGSFFSSPFLYTPKVTCPLDTNKFVGQYLIEQISGLIDGPTLSDGSIVTLEIGESSVTRVFQTANYPLYCASLRDFTIEFICGEIQIPSQSSGCSCSDGSDWFTDPEVRETYDPNDDSIFLITFTDDTQGDCGSPAQTTYRFTKQ